MEQLFDIFKRSPEEALEELFIRDRVRNYSKTTDTDSVFVWQSTKGLNSNTRYGSYKILRRKEFVDRKFEIVFIDNNIGIKWTDSLYDPRSHKHSMI